MPAQFTGDLQTVLTAAAFAPLADRAFLRITGADASRWLNGMVTNNIQALQPGEGNYNFLLNAQGRIQGDGTLYREPFAKEPTFVLETDTTQIEAIQQLLDRFIIMDDVELAPGISIGNAPFPEASTGMTLIGPQCAPLLAKLLTARKDFAALEQVAPGILTTASFEGHEVVLLAPPAQTIQTCEIWCSQRDTLQQLCRLLESHHVLQASPDTLEALRILQARPRYSTDIRNTDTAKDLPQETDQTHALHFSKGCYVGQEIVERIRSRGQVHRLFTPFRLDGPPPLTLPAALTANGKPAGELTSAATLPTTEGAVTLALGYARREFLNTETPLAYPGGIAHPRRPGQLM